MMTVGMMSMLSFSRGPMTYSSLTILDTDAIHSVTPELTMIMIGSMKNIAMKSVKVLASERCLSASHISLKTSSMLRVSIITVQSMNTRPKPNTMPLLVCMRYELTKPMMTSTACGWLSSAERNHASIYLL